MNRKKISSGSKYEPLIGFSRAVMHNNRILVSGTAPIADDGSSAYPGNLYKQTKRCIYIIQKAIEDAGGKLEDVVRTRIYLTDISIWEKAAQAHREYFSNIRPASTFIEVKGFIKKDWLVEIEAEAVISDE